MFKEFQSGLSFDFRRWPSNSNRTGKKIRSSSQLALATYWDQLAAGRRFPAFTEFQLPPGLHDPKQLVAWGIEGSGRLRKFRALYQGESIADVFSAAWAGKTMEQVVPMSLRKITLDAAKECANSGCIVYSIFSTIDASDTRVDCHRLLLPFGRDGTRVEQMLGSLQLTAVQNRSRVLNHFDMQTDVQFVGRIKSGFTQPKPELVSAAPVEDDKRKVASRKVKRAAKISFAKQHIPVPSAAFRRPARPSRRRTSPPSPITSTC